MKLGSHGPMSADQARTLAQSLLGRIAHGEDPALQKKEEKKIPTMGQLAQEYLEKHAPKKEDSSVRNDRSLIKNVLIPTFGSQKITDITRHKIASLHAQYQNRKTQGNRLLALLSKLYNLAIDWGYCRENPVKGIKRYTEKKRDRWLNKAELKKLLEALEDYPHNTSANFVRMLLLTGARKGETLCLKWDQLDLEKGFWLKEATTTKGKKPQYKPLSQPARELLKTIKSTNQGIYVFPGKGEGTHLKEPKRFWGSLKKRLNLKDVTLHDLRHTYASHLASQGVSLAIIGQLLGHSQIATTQRYAHLAYEALQDATDLFGNVYTKAQSKED